MTQKNKTESMFLEESLVETSKGELAEPTESLGEEAAEGAAERDAKSAVERDASTTMPLVSVSQKPDILYVSGSPRSYTSEALAALVEKGARTVGARSQHFFLSKKRIVPCVGCGSCSTTGTCVLANKTVRDKLIDDYLEFHALLERADALVIVAPIYFAGPSAQLKALFDRLQPYWAKRYVLGEEPRPKRPAQLFVVGGGGDEHGHAPLVGIAKSALAVAGFTLDKVHSFVGFKAKDDLPHMPSELERESLALGELAYLRRAVAAQSELEQRAVDAGGAFARYLERVRVKQELQSKLQEVEEEIAAIQTEGDVASDSDASSSVSTSASVSTSDAGMHSESGTRTEGSPKNEGGRIEAATASSAKDMSVNIAYEEMRSAASKVRKARVIPEPRRVEDYDAWEDNETGCADKPQGVDDLWGGFDHPEEDTPKARELKSVIEEARDALEQQEKEA